MCVCVCFSGLIENSNKFLFYERHHYFRQILDNIIKKKQANTLITRTKTFVSQKVLREGGVNTEMN